MPNTSAEPKADFRMGVGACSAHHGEILQGQFFDTKGRMRRGLVTLPLPAYGTRATFSPAHHDKIIFQPDPDRQKAANAARHALAVLQRPHQGGSLFLSSNCPIGWGLGSSTCDVVATIRAIADAYGAQFSSDEIARLAVISEVASDAVMFEQSAVLFAQRAGIVIEEFATMLPPFAVVGVNTDMSGAGFSTLNHPFPVYTSLEIDTFEDLRKRLRLAIEVGDSQEIAGVATTSARINNRYLPKPRFSEIVAIAKASGAMGVQVAHSGPIVGLLFDPRDPNIDFKATGAISALSKEGLTICYRAESSSQVSALDATLAFQAAPRLSGSRSCM